MKTITEMINIIYEYENKNEIKENERLIKLNRSLNILVPNRGITNNDIITRCKEIEVHKQAVELEEKQRLIEKEKESEKIENAEVSKEITDEVKQPKLDEIKIVIGKQLKNHEDIGTYSFKNYKNAITSYINCKTNKRIAIKTKNNCYDIVKKNDEKELSFFIINNNVIEEDQYYINYFNDRIYNDIHNKEIDIINEIEEKKNREIRQKNIKINPENKKRYKTYIKKYNVIQDVEFDGFDFRKIDLSETIFINCSFVGANLTDQDLSKTIFINTEFEKSIHDGTDLKKIERIC